ncbi:MAG: hypothetical protein H0T15_03330 [Thermoleophilaceae bacterium]|nr:hypothetical protein [Thermoleophilaceae bacterium]
MTNEEIVLAAEVAGDRVLLPVRTELVGKASGIAMSNDDIFHVWRVREGRVVHMRLHVEEAAAGEDFAHE